MKTAPRLQELVERSARRFGLDLNDPEAYLRIEDRREKSITIHKIDTNLLVVGEFLRFPDKEPVGNPEFIFFTGNKEWVPLSHETPEKGFLYGGLVSSDNSEVTAIVPRVQAEIAIEADWWAEIWEERDYSEAEATFEPGHFIPSWEKKDIHGEEEKERQRTGSYGTEGEAESSQNS